MLLGNFIFPFTEFNKILVKDLREFPIPKLDNRFTQAICDFTSKILNLSKTNDYDNNKEKQQLVSEYEKQIDIMVYKLYDLTYQEVLIIDRNFELSEQDYNNFQI